LAWRQHAPRAFIASFLHDYRNRTEALRALANHALLRLLADAKSTKPSVLVLGPKTQTLKLLIAAVQLPRSHPFALFCGRIMLACCGTKAAKRLLEILITTVTGGLRARRSTLEHGIVSVDA
jgi:hypothetical protein